MSTYFEKLEAEIPTLEKLKQNANADASGFFIQEVIRFYSIAGTLLKNRFTLDPTASVNDRYLTHILTRSLLENYFTIMYIFDDPCQTSARYDEFQIKNSFEEDYRKLMKELNEPEWQNFMKKYRDQLTPANPKRVGAKNLPNVNTMLTELRNNYGDRLNYLYPVYRISSFDVHGRSLEAIFKAVFGKTCNFPALEIKYAFELMANQYLCILEYLRKNKTI